MATGIDICMMESSGYSPVFMASNLFHINNVKLIAVITQSKQNRMKKGDYHYESYFN